VRELSQKDWVYSITMHEEITCINFSLETPTNYQSNIPSSPSDHTSPVNDISSQGQTGIKSTRYTVPTKLIQNNPMNLNKVVSVNSLTRNFSVKKNLYIP